MSLIHFAFCVSFRFFFFFIRTRRVVSVSSLIIYLRLGRTHLNRLLHKRMSLFAVLVQRTRTPMKNSYAARRLSTGWIGVRWLWECSRCDLISMYTGCMRVFTSIGNSHMTAIFWFTECEWNARVFLSFSFYCAYSFFFFGCHYVLCIHKFWMVINSAKAIRHFKCKKRTEMYSVRWSHDELALLPRFVVPAFSPKPHQHHSRRCLFRLSRSFVSFVNFRLI